MKCDTQRNDTQYRLLLCWISCMLSVIYAESRIQTHHAVSVCWISLCRVSLCWMPWRRLILQARCSIATKLVFCSAFRSQKKLTLFSIFSQLASLSSCCFNSTHFAYFSHFQFKFRRRICQGIHKKYYDLLKIVLTVRVP